MAFRHPGHIQSLRLIPATYATPRHDKRKWLKFHYPGWMGAQRAGRADERERPIAHAIIRRPFKSRWLVALRRSPLLYDGTESPMMYYVYRKIV